ncbi:MAG TPA: hypothetical protein VFM63_14965 [Pyrinomonadaceae bacterium]|nr:hypothetical protein [Pyrinomonadaceae bacterium]
MTDLPVACSLMPAELQERRRGLLAKVRGKVTDVTELEDGFRYTFPLAGDVLTDVTSLIQLEHQCCPFLTFRLTIEAGGDSVLLELTGPNGTKEFLAEIFN